MTNHERPVPVGCVVTLLGAIAVAVLGAWFAVVRAVEWAQGVGS